MFDYVSEAKVSVNSSLHLWGEGEWIERVKGFTIYPVKVQTHGDKKLNWSVVVAQSRDYSSFSPSLIQDPIQPASQRKG